MVYCGLPSKACQPCRKRRTKCDERRPFCGQCMRTERKCSGYRDIQGLTFRDQSEAIIKKVKAQAASAPKSRLKPIVTLTVLPPSSLVLHPSANDRAMGLFISHYILGKSRSFEYLDKFFAKPMMDDHLSACIDALSLANFAEEAKSSDLLKQARLAYCSGLRLTNLALRSPDVAVKDSTLLAILLLHEFEKVTAIQNLRPLATITEHINGASKLVHLRGQEQFCRPVGLRMFAQLNSMLFISCAQTSARVPEEIIALRNHYKFYLDAADPGFLVSEAMLRYVQMRADIRDGVLAEPADIIAEAKRQDDLCASLSKTLRLKWPYEILFTGDTISAYEGVYHMYSIGYKELRFWNSIRCGRIMLNEIIREQYLLGCATGSLLTSAMHFLLFEAATENIASIASEITGCVPQFSTGMPSTSATSGPSEWSLASSPSSSSERDYTNQKFTYDEQARAYTLIYSLYIIGRSSEQPEKLYRWVIDRLHYIGYVVEVQDAIMVASLLEQRVEIDPWAVCAMTGCVNVPI